MLGVVQKSPKNVLITGGAGFIGTNLAAYLLGTTDARVTILDNLSSAGAEINLAWLQEQAGSGRLRFVLADTRHGAQVKEALRGIDEIYHLAGSCAPAHRACGRNAEGIATLLECVRKSARHPSVVYVSTSEVYESLDRLPVKQEGMRYTTADPNFRGISESAPVDLSSPFASPGAVGERVLQEQARQWEIPAVVLRVDTVAGPRQFAYGNHGWVAHSVNRALSGRPITVFGSGLQVRDVLHVSDLVEALLAAQAYIGLTAGKVYNVGGGLTRSTSMQELIALIERVCHQPVNVCHAPKKAADIPLYISDSWRFLVDTGWMARRTLEQTIRDVAAFWHARQGATTPWTNPRSTRSHAAAA